MNRYYNPFRGPHGSAYKLTAMGMVLLISLHHHIRRQPFPENNKRKRKQRADSRGVVYIGPAGHESYHIPVGEDRTCIPG